MYVIYKYEVFNYLTFIEVSKDSKILKVAEQNGNLFVWVLQQIKKEEHLKQKNDRYKIIVFGTGILVDEEMFKDLKYLDSVVMKDTNLVWHVFYKKIN